MTRPVTLSEPHFSQHTLNKYASLMAQGNGYLGLRASHEEDYTRQTRGMYLAGLYHRAGKGEINELVNLPDILGMEIAINGEVFSLSREAWQRELDFASGELRRSVVWRTSNGTGYTIASRRFVSADQLPLIVLEITITPLDADASVLISTGIDATQTNHGRQHLDETQVRVFGQHLMQGIYTTQDGRSDVAISCCCMVSGDVQQCYTAKERRLQQHTSAQLHAGETVTLQKLVWIDWRDDRQAVLDEWGSASLRQLEMCAQQSYDQLLAVSTENWRQWWQKRRITVNGGEAHDQQALDYALYHLRIMTPAHDERSSIAAKGLTGEGYKGHVFWDTEVFLLPFHLFSDPTVARSLLRYRWHNLPGAQEKARRNGWQGALFPWESARSGEEETPEFAAINIRTGLRQKVASAQAEHHLVADIAWAVIQYWQTTGDESFIAHEGMALLMETAKFWISRAVRVNDRLEIHDVIGPDEYTEHVNNNAFTSYMVYYNVQQALSIARQFGCSDDAFIHRAEMFLKELRLPEIQPDGVLPQDDSFMTKPAINLAKYKAAAGKQTILLDYSRAQVNEMQILKQADVVMLNYMLPEQFSAASCLANLQFYEPRTIHDSSLSKAIHGIVAARCGLLAQSYQFWREGTEIDLGADPHSCDDGIHAAATGAIWLGAIQGFAGVSVHDGELHLNPALPEQWQQLSFPLFWQGCELQVTLDAQRIAIRTSAPVSLRLNGQLISVAEESVFCLGDYILPFNRTATTHLHFQAWQQIAAEIGISIDAQFNESLKGISRDESLRRILQHGGKEGDFNPQERAQLAYRKNLLYVHSLRELTVNAVLPGIRNLLAELRAQQIPVGLASVSLNAPTILAALELREFFTFCADASQLKNSKPDPEIFLAACAGLGVPPQACIGIEDAQAGIDAINASGMRSVGIGAGLTGAQLLLPSTDSLTWSRLSAFWQNV
ncbi:beta-phosphoglucomutase [Escherichia coli]|nr:beta-phosphoglucomutase [Escherichia coli]